MASISSNSEDLRKDFYRTLEIKKLPEGWSIMKNTVYTHSPTFQKKIDEKREIRVMVNITEQNGFCIMTQLIVEDNRGYQSQLGHRWELDIPKEAVHYLIEVCIPHSENEFIN